MHIEEYTNKYNFLKDALIAHDSCVFSESLNNEYIRITSKMTIEKNSIPLYLSFNAVYKITDEIQKIEVECIGINMTGFKLDEHTASRVTQDSQFQEAYDVVREQQIAKELFEF